MNIDKGHILVIDDEPSVADALRIIFEDNGYEVVVALTGLEGIEIARRRCFNVVVSDVRLPDVTGLEVLDAVRQGCSRCVVILITSQRTTNLMDEARERGAFDVLQKPFSPGDVLGRVSAALASDIV
jgi:DNA-binding NtrC family response regulator